jgi:hypothetical protein
VGRKRGLGYEVIGKNRGNKRIHDILWGREKRFVNGRARIGKSAEQTPSHATATKAATNLAAGKLLSAVENFRLRKVEKGEKPPP